MTRARAAARSPPDPVLRLPATTVSKDSSFSHPPFCSNVRGSSTMSNRNHGKAYVLPNSCTVTLEALLSLCNQWDRLKTVRPVAGGTHQRRLLSLTVLKV